MMIHFVIKYHNDTTYELSTASGITFGKDIGDAVTRVVNWFGRDNLINLQFYPLEEVLYDEDLKIINESSNT